MFSHILEFSSMRDLIRYAASFSAKSVSKSNCYTISFQLCLHNTQGFSSSHSYPALVETFVAPLFPYCIFSTTYFSGHEKYFSMSTVICFFLLLFNFYLRL